MLQHSLFGKFKMVTNMKMDVINIHIGFTNTNTNAVLDFAANVAIKMDMSARLFSSPLSFSLGTSFAWFSPPRHRDGPEPLSPVLLAGVGKGRAPIVVVGLVFV
jgi:hypothetical protein